jgi:DnaJ family protein C protein 27
VRLGSCDVRVNLWDLAGGEEYFEVRNEFYKEAQGCILVYDVNNRASFQVRDRVS